MRRSIENVKQGSLKLMLLHIIVNSHFKRKRTKRGAGEKIKREINGKETGYS